MAITYPRELPEGIKFTTAEFVLNEQVRASPSGSRLINYTQIADPAWMASMVTKGLLYSEYAALEAWWLSLRDGLRRVMFRHPHVCYPKNHGQNKAPADDPGAIASVTAGNVLAVNSVDAALSLVVGDRIGLENGARRHIGRVTEVSGAGTSRTITIEPPPFAAVSSVGTVVRFARPGLVMRPVPSSWSVQPSGSRYVVSFQLVEGQ